MRVGPQTTEEYYEALDRVGNRAESADRACRNHAGMLADLAQKIEQLNNRMPAQESRGDNIREQLTTERQNLLNLGSNIEKQYATAAATKTVFAELEARVETLGIQM